MFSSRKVMSAIFVAIIMATVSAVWYVASPASAATDKVYVCKYVGKPGEDERLKDGKQPIEVAVSSIGQNQWNGQAPGYFNDAHDRSYVLGYVGEIPEPSAADCPGGDNPPDDEQIELPEAQWDDPCGPDNATWIVPADTEMFDWNLLDNGHLTVTIIKDGFVFSDDTTTSPTSHDYGVAPDFNDDCPPETIPVPTASASDPCGPGNAVWNVPNSDNTFAWDLLDNGHLIVTIQQEGSVFPGGDYSHDFGQAVDSGKLCDNGEVGPGGDVSVSSTCESITIGTPTYSPEDATATIKLNDKVVQPGTYGVKPGEYTVELLVNDEMVQAHKLVVEKCASGGNGGGHNPTPTGGLNNPAYAETGH